MKTMCLNDESFQAFKAMLPESATEKMYDGFWLLGEAQTLWVWLADHAMWCIGGVVS